LFGKRLLRIIEKIFADAQRPGLLTSAHEPPPGHEAGFTPDTGDEGGKIPSRSKDRWDGQLLFCGRGLL